jgi:hypothetical protein
MMENESGDNMPKFMTASGRRLRGGGKAAVLVAVSLCVGGMALASPALAKEPTGDFAVFKQCPRFTTGVFLCMHAETLSGSVTLNKQTVPLNEDKKHPIVLQGGIIVTETGAESFVGALNGETLSKTPQNIPGGLTGLVNCTEIKGSGFLEGLARAACKLVFENKTTGVSAVTELAKPASEIAISTRNLEIKEGTALGLPVKVRLENTFLGSECYIGSSAHPINLNLTTGTTNPNLPNKPITGKAGFPNFLDEFELLEITENTLVNNEFAAPEATGCGGIFAFLIDPIIDAKIGLPSADGHNTAIQNNTVKLAGAEAVIASEK